MTLSSDDVSGSAKDSTCGNLEGAGQKKNTGKKNNENRILFIEMFAGARVLGKSVKSWDVYVHLFDVKNKCKSKPMDLLDARCQEHIGELLASPNCGGLWFAMPGGTFSSARRYDGKGPRPLRSREYVTGFPSVTGRDTARVASANELVKVMSRLYCQAVDHDMPFMIENPRSSLLWQMPLAKELAAKTGVDFSRYDYCQFGRNEVDETYQAYGMG